MQKQLDKKYDPKAVEDRLYAFWEKNGFFKPQNEGKKSFTIVIPPPNITGQLHMGHALNNTLQDILIRYRRMCGYDTLWLPGTDHASIATEAKIVEALRKEGKSKDEVGREGFLERAWDWNDKFGSRIIEQLKKLGSSCDWSRRRFTLDEGCSKAVKAVFLHLYEKGLIYRGKRIVNWCPHCLTTISDVEVEYEEQQGHFWHIRYPFKDGSGYIEVATTRPETMLGDTAVAVNPGDERYKAVVGKTLVLPLVGREIPVIADEYVDKEFGTGAVKITPAHDPNDFEVGRRHGLEAPNIFTPDAHIVGDYEAYAGMDRFEARKAVLRDLKAGGFLLKTEDCVHNVGTCSRCGTTVEPRVSLQWFVSMKELAKPAIEAVKDGSVKFVPDRFAKIYFNWMENIRDWCISRQLWWGHRIPAFYCDDCGELVVTDSDSAVCPKCGKAMRQDPDTLDTWFSSALWPFSTLGWPDDTDDFRRFYPTNTLVTAYDIITFWVSRMIFSALEYTGKAPFDTVLIHGLIRDGQGRKMSKSLGNGIDPLEVIDQYGADALRFALATGNSPGNDMRFTEKKVLASRNFANKLWNAARFVLMNLGDGVGCGDIDTAALQPEDKWVLSRCNSLVREVRENLEKFELGIAVSKLYDFVWDVFCDWYIELVKPRLSGTAAGGAAAQSVLVYVLSNTMKLLHPFMPFITEEIWQTLPHEGESIMVSPFPEYKAELAFGAEERATEAVIEAIKAVRELRAEKGAPPSRKAHIYVRTDKPELFANASAFFEKLASASAVELVGADFKGEGMAQAVTFNAVLFLPLDELVDKAAERARLAKELAAAETEEQRAAGKLANAGFVARAPQPVVDAEREKQRRFAEKAAQLRKALKAL